MSSIGPAVSEEKMFENVDGRTTDAGVTGILLAHQWAFGLGELIMGTTPSKESELLHLNIIGKYRRQWIYLPWLWVYKTLFILNWMEHEIYLFFLLLIFLETTSYNIYKLAQ